MTDKARRNAEGAAAILDNPIFRDAMCAVDADLIMKWRNANTFEDREDFFYQQKALQMIWDILLSHLEKAAAEERKVNGIGGYWSDMKKALTHWRHKK